MEWSKTHVTSTFHICWGAQAGLYYHFGIKKYPLEKKLSGVYKHTADYKRAILLRGFDDEFYVPHSRYTGVRREDIEKVSELKILASSKEAGVYIATTENGKQIFVTGHSEYDVNTLKNEYNETDEDNYFDETPLGTIALASEDTGMTYTLQWDISYDSKVFPVMTVAADFFH